MKEQFKIKNKIINIYFNNSNLKELPVVILNNYSDNAEEVYNKCNDINCNEFILVSISNLDWNNDMSPWYTENINNYDSNFLGKADEYIDLLVNDIMQYVSNFIINKLNKNIKYYTIAGYSLAGLFSVYIAYKTDIFKRIVSASGSFWYPDFLEFVKKNNISYNIEKIYFSLGNRESKVKNKILSEVENNTKELENIYKDKGINTVYIENDGNHFQEVSLRIAKGIKWVLY